MAYEDKDPIIYAVANGAAPSIAATGVTSTVFRVSKDCQLAACILRVVAPIVSAAPAVVTLKKRILPNSATGEVIIGTMSIPGGTAAGVNVYRYFDEDLAPNTLRAGDELVADVTTAATTSGSIIFLPEVWENPRSQFDDPSKLVVTA